MNKYRRFFIKKFSLNILISGIFFSFIPKQNYKFLKKNKKLKSKNHYYDKAYLQKLKKEI